MPSNSTPDHIVARKLILKIMQNDGHVTDVVNMTAFKLLNLPFLCSLSFLSYTELIALC